MVRLFVTILIAVMPLLSGTVDASSYFCPDATLEARIWVETYLETADVVALGEVVSEETPTYPTDGETRQRGTTSTSMAELLRRIEEGPPDEYSAHHYQYVTFQFVDVWKGDTHQNFGVLNRVIPGMEGWPLQVGETYLIFAYRDKNGRFLISTRCTATQLLANAEQRIAVLDEIRERSAPSDSAAD